MEEKNTRMDTEQLRQSQKYLAPEMLIANEANEKARPAEKPEERAARVRDMAVSIAANGQEYPVLVVEKTEDGITTYEYVDGGCRVEAIAALNSANGSEPREVWCSLVEPADDLFRRALTANLHRTQNSLMDMAYICQEVRDRNNWKGKGGGQQVADYLGLPKSRVSEYEKLLRAAPGIKAKIASGEIGTLQAALKLLSVPEEKQAEVAERAAQEAIDEEAERQVRAKEPKKAKGKKLQPLTPEQKKVWEATKAGLKADKAKVKVKAKHVERAAKEVSGEREKPARGALVEFFEQVTEAAYGPAAVKFAEQFVKYAAGEVGERAARNAFDALDAQGKRVKAAVAKKATAPKKKK